jgi:hypothetical protein
MLLNCTGKSRGFHVVPAPSRFGPGRSGPKLKVDSAPLEIKYFWTEIHIYNIRTLSVNIKFICTSFRNRHNSEPSASFSGLFRSEYKWIWYLTTMYVFCVYPSMSKKSENLSDLDKKEKQASFLAFHKCCQGCLLRGPHYISTSFIHVCALRCT